MQHSRFIRFLAFAVCLAALISLLFFAVRITIVNRTFFENEYTRLDHARSMGMQTSELTDATMQMIKYMEGTADSIDLTVTVGGKQVSMFNDRERAHMVDVRVLYQNFKVFSYIASAAFAALVVLSFRTITYAYKGETRKVQISAAHAFLQASMAFIVLMVAVGLWVLLDFNSFWTSFHLLFFTNDLWILDPATSRMINMMPWQLFYDIVLRAGMLFAGIWAVLAIIAAFLSRRERRRAA